MEEKLKKKLCSLHHPAAEGGTLPCWHSPDSWGIQQEGWWSPECGFHWWSLARPSAVGARRNPLREEVVKTRTWKISFSSFCLLLPFPGQCHTGAGAEAGAAAYPRTPEKRQEYILDWFPASEHTPHSSSVCYLESRWGPSSWCWPCCCCHSWCDRRWRADDASRAAESEARSYTEMHNNGSCFS